MSEINEKQVNFAKPSEEDEGAKLVALEDWTNDRMKLLGWRPETSLDNGMKVSKIWANDQGLL